MLNKKYLFIAISWTLSVLYLSFREKFDMPDVKIDFADKLVHFTFYFLFVYFWYQSISYQIINKKLLYKITFFSIIFSIVIEIGQETLTQNRHFDWFDIVANSLGALSTVFIITKFYRKFI